MRDSASRFSCSSLAISALTLASINCSVSWRMDLRSVAARLSCASLKFSKDVSLQSARYSSGNDRNLVFLSAGSGLNGTDELRN